MRIHLSDALHEMRVECQRRAGRSETFPVSEVVELTGLLWRLQQEAVRLETVEVAARAQSVADRALRALERPRDVDRERAVLEALITGDKVLLFPHGGRRREASL